MNKTLVGRVEGDPRLHRVLVTALGWHHGDRPFEKFEQGVLDALSQVLEARPTPLDLVYLVDENDALLGNTEVAAGSMDQTGKTGPT